MRSILGRILLPTILGFLAYGFWISPNFKEIAAGVAIFLFGMLSLEEGFRAFTGGMLEKVLKRTTDKLWKSLSFGVISTTIMQSSSLVSVITISFLSAGLIGLREGMGIIFGANLGTTTGAWLVAGFGLKVDIASYAMPMLVFGVIMIFQKMRYLKGAGYVLAGLGFLFLGIHHMKEGFEAFKAAIDLTEYAVAGYPGLFLYTLIGLFATVIMQSSHATLVLIITALAANQISYENALALAIGANVGTTITAIIGSFSSNEQGKRLAGAHLIFNIATGLIAIIFIQQFLALVEMVSSAIGIREDDYTLKLAVFHTLFNLAGVLVMIPFINRLAVFLEGVFASEAEHFSEPKYLNESAIEFSDTALEALRLEMARIYDKTISVIARGLSFDLSDALSDDKARHVIKPYNNTVEFDVDDVYDHEIKSLCSAVMSFSNRLSFDDTTTRGVSRILLANQSVLIAMKELKHLQKNMHFYANSENPVVSQEYNRLRQRVSSAIHRIDEAKKEGDFGASILSLDALRLTLEQNMEQLQERMDELIRDSHVSAHVAISLMNDSHYTYSIIHNLIQIVHNCLKSEENNELEAEHMVSLNNDEINSVLIDNE